MEQSIKELTDALNALANNSPSNLEIAAFIISIIALVISLYDIFIQRKMNQANLQAVYFTEIFGDYLKLKIPTAVKNLNFNESGKLDKSYKSLIKILFAMIRDSGYFSLSNSDFYKKLERDIQNLEDFLIELGNKTIIDRDDQYIILMQIHKKVEAIVHTINAEYEKM